MSAHKKSDEELLTDATKINEETAVSVHPEYGRRSGKKG